MAKKHIILPTSTEDGPGLLDGLREDVEGGVQGPLGLVEDLVGGALMHHASPKDTPDRRIILSSPMMHCGGRSSVTGVS